MVKGQHYSWPVLGSAAFLLAIGCATSPVTDDDDGAGYESNASSVTSATSVASVGVGGSTPVTSVVSSVGSGAGGSGAAPPQVTVSASSSSVTSSSATGGGGMPPANGPVTTPPPSFARVDLFTDRKGAGWLTPIDLNSDGFDELLLSCLSEGPTLLHVPPIGPGGAYVLQRDGGAPNGTVGTWSVKTKAFNYFDGILFPNRSSVFDVDNDGVKDWVIAAGFLVRPTGNIVWMKGTKTGNDLDFGPMQKMVLPDDKRWYHELVPVDFDNDGDMDFVTTNHNGTPQMPGTSQVEWFENQGVMGEANFTHHVIASVGGVHIELHDLDADGDLDILLPQFFAGPSLIWLEHPGDPNGVWTQHTIDSVTGKGFEVKVVDLDGNGKLDVVYNNHNHQLAQKPEEQVMGVYWWEIPDPSVIHTLTNWDANKKIIHEGFNVTKPDPNANGAPGPFHVGDIDGDGDLDVSVAGDGDEGAYVFVQNAGSVFQKVQIDTGLIMSADHHMMDLNGDGKQDFVWNVYGNTGLQGPQSMIYGYIQQ